MNADHYAIVVGIDAYVGLKPLQAAKTDATTFAEWLLDPDGGGLPEENVRLILSPETPAVDRIRARPAREDVEIALRDFGASENKRVGARLYFYFAGHGIGPEFDEVAMLMANAADRSWYNIGLRPCLQLLHDKALFDEAVFVLDCCREAKTARPYRPEFENDVGSGAAVNDFVVLASVYKGLAHEPFDEAVSRRRGLLTQALIEALQGAPGAVDPSGNITSATLAEYVVPRVSALADKAVVDQQADPPRPANPAIIFRKLAPEQLPSFTLTISPGQKTQTSALVIKRGSEPGILHSRPASGSDWVLTLPANSRYKLEIVSSGQFYVVDPLLSVNGAYDVPLP
ncbi:MAG TPA: caspase family protein [Caulobacteraceae bacterium]|jgi:hypothetical protein